jgi:hypothetical protein
VVATIYQEKVYQYIDMQNSYILDVNSSCMATVTCIIATKFRSISNFTTPLKIKWNNKNLEFKNSTYYNKNLEFKNSTYLVTRETIGCSTPSTPNIEDTNSAGRHATAILPFCRGNSNEYVGLF